MGFKLVPLIAVAVLGLGNLLHIIGLATPEWVEYKLFRQEFNRGLWEGCVNDHCDSFKNDYKSDWLKACEALAILGMLAGVTALGMAGFAFLMGIMGKDSPNIVGVVAALASVTAFILIIICVIVYGVKSKDESEEWDFGYSFGLCIAGAILILIGGPLSYAGSRN